MRMMLMFENGLRAEAVLLASGDFRMRVVIRGSDDTAEFRLVKDQWMSEEGVAVDIGSVIMTERVFARLAAHGHAA